MARNEPQAVADERRSDGGSDGEHLWLIDPIDGTANYARGLPRYCVSIGYLERLVPTGPCIYRRVAP